MFGLPERVIELLRSYFKSHPQITKVFVFGSRAMDKQSVGSDVDLAIITKADKDISGTVKADLDELSTPYMFDVIDYRKITNPSLSEHIDRVGKVLFSID